MDLNVEQVEELLLKFPDEDDYGIGWSFWNYEADDGENVEDLGTVEVVDNFGGEGMGDHAHLVFRITNPDGVRHFKIDGYYASYDGTTWDGRLYEVKPVEKTVTVYE